MSKSTTDKAVVRILFLIYIITSKHFFFHVAKSYKY